MQTDVVASGSPLRISNAAAAILHALQALAVLMLANDFALPVTGTFLEGPPGTDPGAPSVLFEIRVAWGVAAFLGLSALAHLFVASPIGYEIYRHQLGNNRNYLRWIEYSISASIMMVLIAMLPGISDVTALIGIFVATAAMILFGLLMEQYEQPGRPNWNSFIFGSIVGLAPWLGIAIYLWSPTTDASPPTFVYGIFVSLFLFFNSFAINMILQYKLIGPWRRYLFGEYAYVVLSLTSKSALAWQVFAGTLAPQP